ncbi:MAG: flagellar assembly protein FliW [Actinomycetota bacterium]|nr:flagellar assembly protein FliW [Actinomycetota bacterium]
MSENTEPTHPTATLEPMTDALLSRAGLVFDFPAGIPGFTDVPAFQLVPRSLEFGPYLALKAVGREHPVFVVAQPGAIAAAFDIEIDDASQALIELESAENVLVLVLVTLHGDASLPTANLAAPIVINLANNRGCQVVQPDADPGRLSVEVGVPVYDPLRAAG